MTSHIRLQVTTRTYARIEIYAILLQVKLETVTTCTYARIEILDCLHIIIQTIVMIRMYVHIEMKERRLLGMKKYDLVQAYTIKARLYLNKSQQETVEKILNGVRVFYNCTMYEMLNNFKCTKEVKSKKTPEQVLHYPVWKEAQSAYWKEKLMSEHSIIEEVPAGALMGNNGCIGSDLKRAFGNNSIEYINESMKLKKAKVLKPNERKVPKYYSSGHPRMSYTYQETLRKISFTDNPNVLKMKLNRLGDCKIRGWNQKVKFSSDGEKSFQTYCFENKDKQITVTIGKDSCQDYYICFKFLNVYVPIEDKHGEAVGIDVGLKNIATLSDGTTYEHKRFKKEEKENFKYLNRKLSRRSGWANIKFREEHKKDKEISPSKRYEKTKLNHARLERKVARRRSNWNNFITHEIVENHDALAVESLDVKGMAKNKYIAYDLGDAAIGDILSKLKYKSEWHGKEIREVEKDFPSSKTCSNCGYIREKLSLSTRKWKCPKCGVIHDRDINAAKNILNNAYGLDPNSQIQF